MAPETWSATLVLPTELRDLIVTFDEAGGATMDVPVIDKRGIALRDVARTDERIGFAIGTREIYDLARAAGGGSAKGTATIAGERFLVWMERLAPGEAPRTVFARPQTPRPPFPYATREVSIASGDAKLAGTLTTPAAGAPFPAVLFLTGSGQQDRDETIYGHKPYAILADALTRAGFATLRLDDRGRGKTTGDVGTLDHDVFDAVNALQYLVVQPEVESRRIFVVGHSTGGMVAPAAAVRTRAVAGIVSLAGPTVTGAELLPLQLEAMATAAGAPEAAWRPQVELQRKLGSTILQGEDATRAELERSLGPMIAAEIGREPTKAELDQVVAAKVAEAHHPWTLSFLKLDPRSWWHRLTIPVLLLLGEKDTQVPADAMIAPLERSLGKPELLTAKKLPGLNHLFQHATTGLPDEYATIDESFDPATIKLIVDWLKSKI
jgi:pimeloyl-ACP methyl ester carboxylesterase